MGCVCCKKTPESQNQSSITFQAFYLKHKSDKEFLKNLNVVQPYDPYYFLQDNYTLNSKFSYTEKCFKTLTTAQLIEIFDFNYKTILLFCAFKAELVLKYDLVQYIIDYCDHSVLIYWGSFIHNMFGIELGFLTTDASPDQMTIFMKLFANNKLKTVEFNSILMIGTYAIVYYAVVGYSKQYKNSEWGYQTHDGSSLEKKLKNKIEFYVSRYKQITNENIHLGDAENFWNGQTRGIKEICSQYLDLGLIFLKERYLEYLDAVKY